MVADNLSAVLHTLPEGVQLVAVSKFHPVEALQQAYDAGQRLFGESRVQELTEKRRHLPADIRWHFIGHLQTNKVRQLIGNVDMIESVDSDRLLRLIDKESAAAGVVTRVLLQVHVAAEETKFGFLPDELLEWFRSGGYTTLKATHICGLMAMASNTDDDERVRADFRAVAGLMARIKAENPDLRGFDILSMGMSHDYQLAIAEGATHVRVGSAIFGERKY
ncbi:MAG: YggS family pyridoxal phosphate-dependent enzyme [Muribaculaceae bacterium]|nr:YggS family pyridoxal phosphate-dependent enzyme [Muribaculaceae bacterium]